MTMGEAKKRGTKVERIALAQARASASPKVREVARVGIASNENFLVRSRDGKTQDASYVIFPILRQHADKKTSELIGTGFFVAKGGIFVTAGHVLKAALEEDERGPFGLGIVQLLPDGSFVERPIRKAIVHDTSDIGIGVCAEMTSSIRGKLDNPILCLSTRDPALGEHIFTYAYPDTVTEPLEAKTAVYINPHFYAGNIVEHLPNGRDSVLIPWPCFRTSMHIHGGASGGPVFDSSGAVFGINTLSMEPHTDTSYVTKVRDAIGVVIDEISIGEGTELGRYSLGELAARGYAVIK